MKAIVQDTYGSADTLRLEDIERPEVADDGVLLRVHAAGVDRGVWHLMTGLQYLIRILGFGFRGPKIRVPGMDVAGRVEAVGKGVTQFRVGRPESSFPGDPLIKVKGALAPGRIPREPWLQRACTQPLPRERS